MPAKQVGVPSQKSIDAASRLAGEPVDDVIMVNRSERWDLPLTIGVPVVIAVIVAVLGGPVILAYLGANLLAIVAGQLLGRGMRFLATTPTRLLLLRRSPFSTVPNGVLREVDRTEIQIGAGGKLTTVVMIGSERHKVPAPLRSRLEAVVAAA